jgi:protein TonB
MKRVVTLAGLVCGLLVSGAAVGQENRIFQPGAPPAPPPPSAEALAAPLQADWIMQPSTDQIARGYPLRAPKGLEAHVVLRCRAAATAPLFQGSSFQGSRLEGCKVVSETPERRGFGKAALELSRLYRMRPTDLNKAPVVGREVDVPIHWNSPAS